MLKSIKLMFLVIGKINLYNLSNLKLNPYEAKFSNKDPGIFLKNHLYLALQKTS